MTTKGKVLVLVSSGRGLPLKDGKVYNGAGYYLNELTVPVRALMKEGYEITFANPKGNTPQVDVHSEVADFFGGDAAKLQDYMLFRDGLTGLRDPTRIADVIASGLDQYDAVFVPGGHGPMIDLLDDPDAGTVMRHFHETSKPTAVLCHGPISLLSALPNSKEVVAALAAGDAAGAHAKAQGWIYSGYKMTIFSTAEEQQREPLEIGGKVLFYPDFALRTAGGDVSVLAPWTSYVLQDRELISGQNPFSDQALLNLLLPALNERKRSGCQRHRTKAQKVRGVRAVAGASRLRSSIVTALLLDGGREMDWKRLVQFALLGSSDLEQYAILLVRVSIGLFFAISGANKLFVAGGTKPVYETLVKAKVPFPRQTAYFVAGVEFVCGSLLAVGFLSSAACVALLIDMTVATLTSAVSTLPKGLSPLNWLDDFLYLPEVLYVLFFLWLICSGPGKFSVDYWLAGKLLS